MNIMPKYNEVLTRLKLEHGDSYEIRLFLEFFYNEVEAISKDYYLLKEKLAD